MSNSLIFLILLYFTHVSPKSFIDKTRYKSIVRDMFYFTFNNYNIYGNNSDDFRPVSCTGNNVTYGGISLLKIEILDTLFLLKDFDNFFTIISSLSNNNFDINYNVSVFEVNIRVLGSLLSSHLLIINNYNNTNLYEYKQYFDNYNNILLDLAIDIANRLLFAFGNNNDTTIKNTLPIGTINYKFGIPHLETPIISTATAGTLLLEFGTLSRLTNDTKYENLAINAINYLFNRRINGLFPTHINSQTGQWLYLVSGIGNHIDSFYEYVLKGGILFSDFYYSHLYTDLFINNLYKDAIEQLLVDDVFGVKTLTKTNNTNIFNYNNTNIRMSVDSLSAFFPSLMVLGTGDLQKAYFVTMNSFMRLWDLFGFLPESIDLTPIYHNEKKNINVNDAYFLRPELIESLYYLYKATKDYSILKAATRILDSIQTKCKVKCGYSSIKNFNSKDNKSLQHLDLMESFFLSETLKYLYLIFDDEDNIIDSGNYIFSTEAHLFDVNQIYQISKMNNYSNKNVFTNNSNRSFYYCPVHNTASFYFELNRLCKIPLT